MKRKFMLSLDGCIFSKVCIFCIKKYEITSDSAEKNEFIITGNLGTLTVAVREMSPCSTRTGCERAAEIGRIINSDQKCLTSFDCKGHYERL